MQIFDSLDFQEDMGGSVDEALSGSFFADSSRDRHLYARRTTLTLYQKKWRGLGLKKLKLAR